MSVALLICNFGKWWRHMKTKNSQQRTNIRNNLNTWHKAAYHMLTLARCVFTQSMVTNILRVLSQERVFTLIYFVASKVCLSVNKKWTIALFLLFIQVRISQLIQLAEYWNGSAVTVVTLRHGRNVWCTLRGFEWEDSHDINWIKFPNLFLFTVWKDWEKQHLFTVRKRLRKTTTTTTCKLYSVIM